MITLISGALGTGKTALAVKLLRESEFYPSSVFVYGVRGWKGEGSFYDLKSQEHAKENQQLLEETGRVSHSCYLVDEAKKVWPTRVAGRDEPPFINQHLAESRSVSQDWVLTCQAPGQIDVALRRLVGRHIHLEQTALGIRYSESGSVRDDLKFERDESRKYDFPVESLALYQSDEGVTHHQKKGLKLPKRLISLLLLISVLFGVAVYFWNKSTMFGGSSEVEAGVVERSKGVLGGLGHPDREKAAVLPLTNAPNKYYYLPRDPEYPELARASRLPVSCVASVRKCICYDQAGQLIDGISDTRCRRIVAGENTLAVLYPAPVVNRFPEAKTIAKAEEEKPYLPPEIRALSQYQETPPQPSMPTN